MSLTFCAKAVLLTRGEDGWKKEEVTLKSVEGLRGIFKPFESRVSQVNISKYLKVYYCLDFIKDGMDARTVDMDGDTSYMVSPLLLVECDDEKPINISESCLETLLDSIDFF